MNHNLSERLKQHNSGKGKYSRTYKPWKMITVIAFDSKTKAIRFEKYLKSHSGRAFTQKYL
ncbi:MAG: GIY-YIG nuclease family protein [FCB group bacterium]|nr:GIY-YIG nuclease family protein [FCB group bacterium]